MSRSLQDPARNSPEAHLFPSQLFALSGAGGAQAASRITALSIEFVAKPNETHRLQTALPSALHSTLGEVAGFAGGFVLIANYEARLITLVTLWTGADRMRQCNENLKWIRALLKPYLDRCLRTQTFAALVPQTRAMPNEFAGKGLLAVAPEAAETDAAMCAA